MLSEANVDLIEYLERNKERGLDRKRERDGKREKGERKGRGGLNKGKRKSWFSYNFLLLFICTFEGNYNQTYSFDCISQNNYHYDFFDIFNFGSISIESKLLHEESN